MMASSPSPSSPGGEGIPPDRAEAPGNRRGARRKGGDGVKEGGDDNERPKKDKKKSARRKKSKDRRRGKECLTNTMEKVDALRKQLRDCEETGKASVAQAKGKVVLKKKHGTEIVAEIQKCKGIENEQLAGWKLIWVDIKNCEKAKAGTSLEVELEHLNARLNTAGPSPSMAINEIEARRLCQKEEVRLRFQEITDRLKMFESGRRDGCAGQGDTANITTTTTTTTTITTAASLPTATITPPTPSTSSPAAVSELREEALFLRDRVKMRGELTRDMLEFFDTRQKAVDANIRFLGEALVACKARLKLFDDEVEAALEDRTRMRSLVKDMEGDHGHACPRIKARVNKKNAAPRQKTKERRHGKDCPTKLMEKVDAMRRQLRDCEHTGEASLAQAKGKVVLKKKHAAEIVTQIDHCKGEEEERLAGWKKIQVDIKNWERVCPTIEMGASLNVELERLNARLNAAGPSPSTAVNEIEARRLRQKEEVCPRFQDITNRLIMIESGRRDGFARQGGSTNANTGATAYTTTTTTAASSPTATITPPTPSTSSLVAASELREEALFLRDRVKMRGELTRDMLEYFDTRQKAVDANIRFLEEALVACKARLKLFDAEVEEAEQDKNRMRSVMNDIEIRARIQAASMQRHRAMATPRPENSVLDAIVKWKPGTFSRTFPDHVRALGGEECQKNVLIAERVLSEGGKLCALGKTLGEGGFGRVYEMSVLGVEGSLATKAVTDQGDVSIKNSPHQIAAFQSLLTEMEVHRRLPAHLNISQAKAMDDRVLSNMRISFEQGLCDFTEHAWGLTNMSLGERVGIVAASATGAIFLHGYNIGHNDIKPQNVIIFPGKASTGPVAKLVDLGLALAFGDETQRKGTPGIMAPETMNERRTPCRANQDVFAMAHMLLLVVAKDGIKRDNLFMHEDFLTKYHKQQMAGAGSAEESRLMEWSITLHNTASGCYRRKLLIADNIYDELRNFKDEIVRVLRRGLSPDPRARPPMKTLEGLARRISRCLLQKEKLSAAANLPAVKLEGVNPEPSSASVQSTSRGQGAMPSGLTLAELPAEEMGGGREGGGGPTGGSSVPAGVPVNGNGDLRQGEMGIVTRASARLPQAAIDAASYDAATPFGASSVAATPVVPAPATDTPGASAAATSADTAPAPAGVLCSGGTGGRGDDSGVGGGGAGSSAAGPVGDRLSTETYDSYVTAENISACLWEDERRAIGSASYPTAQDISDCFSLDGDMYWTAHEIPAVLSVEVFPAGREREGQGPGPDLEGSKRMTPTNILNAAADGAELSSVVSPSREGDVLDGYRSGGDCKSSSVTAVEPVKILQEKSKVNQNESDIALDPVGGEGAAFHGPCRKPQRSANTGAGQHCKKEKGARWLSQVETTRNHAALPQDITGSDGYRGGGDSKSSRVAAVEPMKVLPETSTVSLKAGDIAPAPVNGGGAALQGSSREPQRPAHTGATNGRERGKRAERLPQVITTRNHAALRQETTGSTDGGGGVDRLAPTRVGGEEYQAFPRRRQGTYGVRSTESSRYPQRFQSSNRRAGQFCSPYGAGVAAGGAVYWPAPTTGGAQVYSPSIHAPKTAGPNSSYFRQQPVPEVRGGTVFYPKPTLAATGRGWGCNVQPPSGHPDMHEAARRINTNQNRCYYASPPQTAAYEGCAAPAMGLGPAAPLAASINANYPAPSNPGQVHGDHPRWDRAGEPPSGAPFVEEQSFASPPAPRVQRGLYMAYGEQAAAASQPWAKRDWVAASQPPLESQVPPPSQKVLGRAGTGVFPRRGGVVATRGGAGGGLRDGYRAPVNRASGAPTTRATRGGAKGGLRDGYRAPHSRASGTTPTRAQARQWGGASQAGAAHDSSFCSPAPTPQAYSPCDRYDGWTETTQQWPSAAYAPPRYHPTADALPGRVLRAY